MPESVLCCENCRHRHFENKIHTNEFVSSCDSYPNGIPRKIYLHRSVETHRFSDDGAGGCSWIRILDGPLCYGIEGINYLAMMPEDWGRRIFRRI